MDDPKIGAWFCEICNCPHHATRNRWTGNVRAHCPQLGYVYSSRALEMPRAPAYGEMSGLRIILQGATR